jgi:rubredoxin
MKKVEGHLNIEVNISCPHCEDYFDLMDMGLFPHLNEEGYLLQEVLEGERLGAKDLDETIECPECKKEITIGNVWW